MELSDKEFSMIANALDKEFWRLVRHKHERDMFNNTDEDYFRLMGRVMDARRAQLNRGDNATT